VARRALKNLFRHGDAARLDAIERKSLSSFNFGSNQFLLAPEMSSRVLSCLENQTDVASLMGSVTTSAGSIKFLVDNVRLDIAAWACQTACFANNPNPDLAEGLGEAEIKAETLRYIVCAGNDLLADASFPIDQWVMRKVSDAFGQTISTAIIGGTGVGMPMGILNPNSGIPVCDVSERTPPGTLTWQDLVALRGEIPMQWQSGGSYLMNQKTFALLTTMSDATGRPLLGQLPEGAGAQFWGSPVRIVTQMPDVAPGTTPVAFGNWPATYLVVRRTGVTMMPDPYTLPYCTMFRFETRIGGAIICPNAARLLRIR